MILGIRGLEISSCYPLGHLANLCEYIGMFLSCCGSNSLSFSMSRRSIRDCRPADSGAGGNKDFPQFNFRDQTSDWKIVGDPFGTGVKEKTE